MFGRIAALVSVALIGASCATKAVEKEVVSIPVEPYVPTWKCIDYTIEEQYVLLNFKNTRITDKNALATILGNIKRESKFYSNICEGGAEFLTLIAIGVGTDSFQWTTENRYLGLGLFCDKYGCDLVHLRVRPVT